MVMVTKKLKMRIWITSPTKTIWEPRFAVDTVVLDINPAPIYNWQRVSTNLDLLEKLITQSIGIWLSITYQQVGLKRKTASLVTKTLVNYLVLIKLCTSASTLTMMCPKTMYILAANNAGATSRRSVDMMQGAMVGLRAYPCDTPRAAYPTPLTGKGSLSIENVEGKKRVQWVLKEEDLHIPPMSRGMKYQVLCLATRIAYQTVDAPNRTAKTQAPAREGS
jgi:hypothetical protein